MSQSAPTRSAPSRSVDPDRRYMKKAMDAPLLERQQELDLATAWKEKGDEEALHKP
jgi:RNA polymerase sigma-32 factor